jgi:hypothetical protein
MTKDLRRKHKDRHGFPDSTDDYLSEKGLGNVWSVLEPLGNTLKGSLMFKDGFDYIQKYRVLI